LIVPGPAALRPAVLDLVRGAGAEVRGLTAEDGRLDELYRELVGEADGARGREADGRGPEPDHHGAEPEVKP
ncbi:MAG TPA: hypothetical protein VLI67_08900, partial [Vicinamibacteria bacterium]|nr:hypothetical protein [Vicinamibacteria bacterium]